MSTPVTPRALVPLDLAAWPATAEEPQLFTPREFTGPAVGDGAAMDPQMI